MKDLHVLPVGDIIEHAANRGCVCRPRIEESGPDAAVVVHHAADGREYFEDAATVVTETVQ